MKKTLACLLLAVVCGLAIPCQVYGSYPAPPLGFYAKMDLGASWLESTSVEDLFGPVAPGTEMEFDTGFRMGLQLGYQATPWFSGEFEVSTIWSRVKSITGAYEDDADFGMVPFFLNARFQLPEDKFWIVPFAGAGFGGVGTWLTADDIWYDSRSVWGDSSGMAFGWQAFAGVRFYVSDAVSVNLEYRYLYVFEPEMEIDWGYYWYINSDEVELGDIKSHNLSLAVEFRF